MSFTVTDTKTYSTSDARKVTSQVKADLMRLHRLYHEKHNAPSVIHINELEKEFLILLEYDYLRVITYGFIYNGNWVKPIRYIANHNGSFLSDNDPGGISYELLPAGSKFNSVLTLNNKWQNDTLARKQEFEKRSPVKRHDMRGSYGGEERFVQQKTYSSNNCAVNRYGFN